MMPTELMESLYQMNIVEQNINYKILEGMYEEKKSTALNEAKENKFLKFVKFVGEQLKHLWGMIKEWWGKFVHFITKTVPEAWGKVLNKLLVVLKIKEGSIVDVDIKNCSEDEAKKVKRAAATINNANKKSFLSKIKGVFRKDQNDEFNVTNAVKDTLNHYDETQQKINDEADKAMERVNAALAGIPADKAATLKEAFEQHKLVFVTKGEHAKHFNGPLMDIEKVNESVDALQEKILVKMSVEAEDVINEINSVGYTMRSNEAKEISEKKVVPYQERKDELLKYKYIYTIEQLNQDKPVKSMNGAELQKVFNYAQQSMDLIKKNSSPVEKNIKAMQKTLTELEKASDVAHDINKSVVSKLISVINVYLNGVTSCTNDMVGYFTAFQKDLLRYEVENRSNSESEK